MSNGIEINVKRLHFHIRHSTFHNTQHAKTLVFPIHKRIKKFFNKMNYCSALKKKKRNPVTNNNVGEFELSEISQEQDDNYCTV